MHELPQRTGPPRFWLVTRQPAELVTAFVTAPFLVQKMLKTANSEKFVFSCQTASGMREPLVSLVFGRKQAPDAHFAQDSAFSPENMQIPSRRARLSPLCHRSLLGRKMRRSGQVPEFQSFVLAKFESIMERADSLMGKVGSLMPGRRWRRDIPTETRELLAPRSIFRLRSPTKVGIPTLLSHQGRNSDLAPSFRFCPKNPAGSDAMGSAAGVGFQPKKPWRGSGAAVRTWCGVGLTRPWRGPGAGLVWAWRGPGAGLVRAWRGPGAGLVRATAAAPRVSQRPASRRGAGGVFSQSCRQHRIPSTGLLHSILRRAQDCSTHSCADNRIAPAARQGHNGVGPAVEPPGLRHVVDAQDKGQAACEERAPSGRPGHAPTSLRPLRGGEDTPSLAAALMAQRPCPNPAQAPPRSGRAAGPLPLLTDKKKRKRRAKPGLGGPTAPSSCPDRRRQRTKKERHEKNSPNVLRRPTSSTHGRAGKKASRNAQPDQSALPELRSKAPSPS